jgi:hypothetical protein
LTEARLEVNYKTRFTLNSLRSKALQSPSMLNSSTNVNKNISNCSHKNNSHG